MSRLPRLSASQVDAWKPWVICICCYPIARWFYLGWTDGLTANPVEFLTRSSGTWTFVALLLTLSVTPAQTYLGQPALVRLRRLLGLVTFFYATLHMLAWAGWDHAFYLPGMGDDIVDRPFVAFGAVAFFVFFLLALTSNQWSMRYLKKRWKSLHQWIYVATLAVILHYWLHKAGKNDYTEVMLYGSVAIALLAWRLVRKIQYRRRVKPEKGTASGTLKDPGAAL